MGKSTTKKMNPIRKRNIEEGTSLKQPMAEKKVSQTVQCDK
jgi:hypothetical protein